MNTVIRNNVISIIFFAVAFAFVETSVVVYLRALYYPGGFTFPLKPMPVQHASVEFAREFATIVMLIAAGWTAGRSRWSRFSYFMIAFAVWDIFYYVWLKVLLNWPASLLDWDILFLIPVPWIGPVIAPCLISILMIVAGLSILRVEESISFRPSLRSWILGGIGTVVLLYSFMHDTDATLRLEPPQPYRYELLFAGLFLCTFALYHSVKNSRRAS